MRTLAAKLQALVGFGRAPREAHAPSQQLINARAIKRRGARTALVTTQGWTLLNVGSLLPVVLTGVALVWLALRQRQAPEQGA